MKKSKMIALLVAASAFLTSACSIRKNEPVKEESYEVVQVLDMPIIENNIVEIEPTSMPTQTPIVKEEIPSTIYTTYKVQPGDTLYQIAANLYGDSSKIDLIIEYNNIENPDLISVDQVLKIPDQDGLLYSKLMEKLKNINFETEKNNMYDINNYGYLNNASILFDGINYSDNKEAINAYQKVFIIKSSNNIALVKTDEGKTYYAISSDINMLPENKFVEVDISEQETNLYINNQLNYSTPNVTGKDSTPTDVGCFDIDGKAKGTTLTDNKTYWSYVNYWMPYNGGEGLHDADGWRSQYGGDIYHYSGSHGCVNMPQSAAEYIYNNVDVGTIVLVHK